MKINVSKTDLKNLKEEELTYSVNIVSSLTLNWKTIFDEVQEYLLCQHGSAGMKDPHRDLDGNLVFTDCEGEEFGLDGLVKWHVELLEEGELKTCIPNWEDIFYGIRLLAIDEDPVVSVNISPKKSN